MFPTHENETAESLGQHLGEQLRDRLRVALDFATLGAYELSGPEDEDELPGLPVGEPLPHEHLPATEPQQRMFLFAKVAAPCPSSREVLRPRCAVDPNWPRRVRDRPRRRRGGVSATEQPCLCAAAAKTRG